MGASELRILAEDELFSVSGGDCFCNCVCSSTPDCAHGVRSIGNAPSLTECQQACTYSEGFLCKCLPLLETE